MPKERFARINLCLACLLLLLIPALPLRAAHPVPSRPAQAGWAIEVVEDVENVGLHTSLALDSAGLPHISYYSANPDYLLRYAYYDGSSWHTEGVSGYGQFTSLELDSAGRPHIGYKYNQSSDLRYAYYDGTSWQFETVQGNGYTGQYNSLALDSAERPRISYTYWSGTDHDLNYASRSDSGTWSFITVDAGDPPDEVSVGNYTSLELDELDRPHISYQGLGLQYAYYDGSAWRIEIVDGSVNLHDGTSLELDSAGRPHISYFDWGNGTLCYAFHDGTSWYTQTVDSAARVGAYNSLALFGDRPHISYYDQDNQDLKYAYYDGSFGPSESHGSGWQIQTVDSVGEVGLYTSLQLDSVGRAHISYYDETNGDLKYARSDGGSNLPPSIDAVVSQRGALPTNGEKTGRSSSWIAYFYDHGQFRPYRRGRMGLAADQRGPCPSLRPDFDRCGGHCAVGLG